MKKTNLSSNEPHAQMDEILEFAKENYPRVKEQLDYLHELRAEDIVNRYYSALALLNMQMASNIKLQMIIEEAAENEMPVIVEVRGEFIN